MVGIFQGMRAQAFSEEMAKTRIELEKRDLTRQEKRDKTYSQSMRRNLRLQQKKHELDVNESEALASYRRTSLLNAQREAAIDLERNKAIATMNLLNFGKNYRDLAFDQLKEGASEDPDKYAEFTSGMTTAGKMQGMMPEQIGSILKMFPPLKKPEEELSEADKQRGLIGAIPTLIKYAPEAAVDTLRSLGLEDIELGMFKEDEDLPPERTSAISYLSRLFGEGRIPEENLAPALEAAKKGDLAGALSTAGITPERRPTTALGIELQRRYISPLSHVQSIAQLRTETTGREHHAVTIKRTTFGLDVLDPDEQKVVDFEQAKELHSAGRISDADFAQFRAAPLIKESVGGKKTDSGFRPK
jgi:hypothetical protein